MKQITKLVLERKEVEALVRGKVLTLALPSGETVQFEGEKVAMSNRTHLAHGERSRDAGAKILEFLSDNKGKTFPAGVIRGSVGIEWGTFSGAVQNLRRRGLLTASKYGENNNGSPKLAYGISARGLKNED